MKRLVPFRYLIVFATFLLTVLLYVDRICISVAREPMMDELHLTDKQMGWVLSVFALGYAWFQVPAGWLGDRWGPRKVLSLIVSFWSLFTSLTGMAWNFLSLMVARFLFGIGEAGAFPAVARTSYSWIPIKERGLVTGINFSGSRFGAAFALPGVALLVQESGWRNAFLYLGLAGLAWALLWYALFRNEPADHPYLSEDERSYILKSRQQGSSVHQSLTLRALGQSRNVWLMMVQYFCNNFTFFFALTWLFPYLQDKFKLGSVETGWMTALPLLAGGMGNWLSGIWVDRIYGTGQWRRSRRLPALTGFFLSASGLLATAYMDHIYLAVAMLCVTIFGADMTMSPSWSVCTDIGQKNAGVVSGTMNMAGNLGAFVTALAFPYLRDWFGSVFPFFFIGAALNFLGFYCWTMVHPDKPVRSSA